LRSTTGASHLDGMIVGWKRGKGRLRMLHRLRTHNEVTHVLDDAAAMGANVVRTFLQPVIGSLDGSIPTIWNWHSQADATDALNQIPLEPSDEASADHDGQQPHGGLRGCAHTRPTSAGGPVKPDWRAPRPLWFPDEFNWIVGCSYGGMDVRNGSIRNPIGANMSVRTDVLWRAGGISAHLGCCKLGFSVSGRARIVGKAESCEETELCIREDAAKAALTALAGSRGLGTEGRYAREVLPRAVVRDLKVAWRGRRRVAGRRDHRRARAHGILLRHDPLR
jgi:hypothetical protein